QPTDDADGNALRQHHRTSAQDHHRTSYSDTGLCLLTNTFFINVYRGLSGQLAPCSI
ncbi:hypothetical protein KSS87_009136, partial [Heliosperma pusillum]